MVFSLKYHFCLPDQYQECFFFCGLAEIMVSGFMVRSRAKSGFRCYGDRDTALRSKSCVRSKVRCLGEGSLLTGQELKVRGQGLWVYSSGCGLVPKVIGQWQRWGQVQSYLVGDNGNSLGSGVRLGFKGQGLGSAVTNECQGPGISIRGPDLRCWSQVMGDQSESKLRALGQGSDTVV